MATTVIGAFNDFLNNSVNLDPDQTKKARGSRDWLVGQIGSFPSKDEKFPDIYTEKNIFYGSLTRRTKKRPLDDIDMMICLKANGCTYSEYFDRIEMIVPETASRFLEYRNDGTAILNSRKIINAFVLKLVDIPQYRSADIKRNLEAATLNLNSYDWVFDIVPCFFTTPELDGRTYYIIPDGKGNWKKTDPRIDRDRLSALNTSHDGNILNVIRSVKYWNKRATMPTMSSYLLENMIIEYYIGRTTKASKYADIELVNVFLDLHTRVYNTINDPKGIQGNINNLSHEDKVKISEKAYNDYVTAFNAREMEKRNDMRGSINKWREIFGNEFPKYEE
ncbi:MAG: nucleotidyltransferase [Bacteroidota bacterium]|nr:MAG: nucleotidyltransferase [Bacteroidota bacterium]